MTDSHVFVARGDLLRFACDAWMVPTDARLRIDDQWRAEGGIPAGEVVVEAPGAFASGEVLASRIVGLSERIAIATAVPLHGVRSEDDLGHIAGAVEQFVHEGAAAVRASRAPVDAGKRILLALPSFGTDGGGGAHERGRIIERTLRALGAAARAEQVDVALLYYRRSPSYSLAQRIRHADLAQWRLEPAHFKTARALAAHARRGMLVPFMGAGVSISAGAPSWAGLINRLSEEAGLSPQERNSLPANGRSALDQAAILRARFERCPDGGEYAFQRAVARAVDRPRYGLAPALLASLGTEQAITLNYDRLFEMASRGAGVERAVIPGEGVANTDHWLLKLHGSVDDPAGIVLTRSDYLGFNETRAALSSIVKANLLTRHIVFVGFGLQDDHFHEIVHDVRKALPRSAAMVGADERARATALTLYSDPLDVELWSGDLTLVPMTQSGPEPGSDDHEEAARQLEVFLDLVAALAEDGHSYLLDPDFDSALGAPERRLAARLRELDSADEDERALPVWRRVERLLEELGSGGDVPTTRRSRWSRRDEP